ncbi:hypothetical protein QE152_g3559 [Popillia japonica]|uniref:Uncharacterized protein n=1 Tax=Popillia japonica TaxID=7064 RepID=A0AAW1MZV4_POPJA
MKSSARFRQNKGIWLNVAIEVWDPEKEKIITARDIVFDETRRYETAEREQEKIIISEGEENSENEDNECQKNQNEKEDKRIEEPRNERPIRTIKPPKKFED